MTDTTPGLAAHRRLLDALPDAALVVDETRIVGANARAAEMLGIEHADLEGLRLAAIAPQGMPAAGASAAAVADRSGRPQQVDLRRGDGSSLRAEVSVGPLHLDGRRLTLALLRDDTDRRNAEEAIRTSEALLHQAILVAKLGIFDHDQVTDTIYWSPEQRAIHGRGPDEVVTLAAFADQVHPDDRTRVIESVARAHDPAGDGRWEVEHRIVRPDGAVRWLLARSQTFFGVRDGRRQAIRTVGAVADITDQRAAADVLELFRISIDQASDAIFWINRDASFAYVNDEACRALGYTREELLRLSLWDVDPVYSPALWAQRWDDFERARERDVQRVETQHRRKDGSLVRVEVQAQHLPVGDRSLHVAYVRDITERVRLEAQLLQAQKMESVGRLAGGVAHDFNNLLTAIQGNVSLALLDLSPEDPVRSGLEEALKASNSAAKLTRQLLAFARHEVIQPQVLDLNEVVTNLGRMLARLLGEDIDLQVTLDPGVRSVRFDPGQLEQVVVNLAVNARDAMPDGGRLRVETSRVHLDEAVARDHPGLEPGPRALLTVADNGVGMSAEVQAHLFEPFYTTKEVGRGTGLGLAMAYGAVRMNGGSIAVESAPGEGTAFRIYLPILDEPPTLTAPTPIDALAAGAETILVVEDEEQVRNLAVQVLRRQGYLVIAVPNADRALEAVAESPEALDLLITDVVLPGMNGQVLAQRVREMRPEVPVLFTSGYTRNIIVHHGVVDEGIEFLPKPYSVSQLVRRVREILDVGR